MPLSPGLALKVNVETTQDVTAAREEFDARVVEVSPQNVTPELLAACHHLGIQVMALYLGNDPAGDTPGICAAAWI